MSFRLLAEQTAVYALEIMDRDKKIAKLEKEIKIMDRDKKIAKLEKEIKRLNEEIKKIKKI